MIRIEVQDVVVKYDSRPVLDDVTISVGAGELVGLLGPNGSGKTTLLRTISRAVSPTKGTVLIGGEDARRLSPGHMARRLAVVPQTTQVGFDFTVEELVLMGRSPHQGRFSFESRHDREVAHQAMARTRVLHLADRPAAALSGGELQRAIIARALAQQPRVLLLDEPTTHLDMAFQIEVLELMRTLSHEDGLTVLAVLHDLNLASSYCDRLVLLSDGKVYAAGAPEDVLTPDNLAATFGAEVLVRPHPVTGRPHVIALPQPPPQQGRNHGARVHVVCGGGSGVPILRALVRAGYRCSAGVLNAGDTDHAAAVALGLEVAEEAPFCAISDQAYLLNLELAKQANLLLVADVPFGPGNLRNLEIAAEVQRMGKPVVLLERRGIALRDFAGGAATRLYEEIKAGGASRVATLSEALRLLAAVCESGSKNV
jgi:iron complex transport system ATP-binding protein